MIINKYILERQTKYLFFYRIIAIDDSNATTSQKIQLIVNECVYGSPTWRNPELLSSSVSVLFCVCDVTAAGEYCERGVNCDDMSACRLNFVSNVTCTTNKTEISFNDTRAPFVCIHVGTNISCSNNSECCKEGYSFSQDVQQCLCEKVSFNSIYAFICEFLVKPVCDGTICGTNGICQNSELKPKRYFCQCRNYTIFDGTTCVRTYFFLNRILKLLDHVFKNKKIVTMQHLTLPAYYHVRKNIK